MSVQEVVHQSVMLPTEKQLQLELGPCLVAIYVWKITFYSLVHRPVVRQLPETSSAGVEDEADLPHR